MSRLWPRLLPTFFALCTLASGGCAKGKSGDGVDSGTLLDSPTKPEIANIQAAEWARNASKLDAAWDRDRDVVVRRAVTRALARIADSASVGRLIPRLYDTDLEVRANAAYGLGFACTTVPGEPSSNALAAAAIALTDRDPSSVRRAVAWSLARCGGPGVEPLLRTWLAAPNLETKRAAALALGEHVQKTKTLENVTLEALLAVAGDLPEAFFPIGRLPKIAAADRVVGAASAALARRPQGDAARILPVRAIARAEGATALIPLAIAPTPPGALGERLEAVKGVAKNGTDAENQSVLTALLHEEHGWASDLEGAVREARFQPLLVWLSARKLLSKGERAALTPLLDWRPSPSTSAARRRVSLLRCAVASHLVEVGDTARFDACAEAGDDEARDLAKVGALDRNPIDPPKRRSFVALARTGALRARERALELVATHVELDDVARVALVDALKSDHFGLVATASDLIAAHPERASVLAESERKRALDPKAPPPEVFGTPKRDPDPAIVLALDAALARDLPRDAVEVRASLLDAAVALKSTKAREAAERACTSSNVTLRARAAKALGALGKKAKCDEAKESPPSDRRAEPNAPPSKVVLTTDVGTLTLILDAPNTDLHRKRLVGLAASGFYRGIAIHRVAPAFVAQFGDKEGDGFGGSGDWIPCETSLLPFERGTVGMALAGRDTGSSQLFVALEASPHLDGQYTVVGRAEGPWNALVEGDTILDVRVER